MLRKLLAILATAFGVMALFVSPAHADDTPCAGTLTGPVPGNVIVPEGQTCLLSGAQIEGNLFVRAGARLQDTIASAPNTVRGNLQADGGDFVDLDNTRVFGEAATLKGTRAFLGGTTTLQGFRQFRVDGNLMIDGATAVFVNFASVGRNLHVIKSGGTSSSVLAIRGVNQVGGFGRIGGDLVVKDSVASQIDVGSNNLQGNLDVHGNVTTGDGLLVRVNEALGDVSIVDNEARGFTGMFVQRNQAGGNLDLIDNFVERPSFIQSNEVDRNMAVIKTRGTSTKTVTANTVGDTLRCFDNDPPFVGAPNIAAKREGQC